MVRDTGIGIAPAAQARIFRDFEQADDQIARNYGGSGPGLSISDRIAKRMGGRITLQSKPGFGSTFEVSVPLPAHDRAPEQKRFTAPDLTGHPVMLVAPQTIETSLLARRLERWGAETCTTSDLAVARALLPERAWHTVLVDHAVGADAIWRFGQAARRHAARRSVIVTPSTRQDLKASGAAAFTGYLVKPLRTASIAARLSAPADDSTSLWTTGGPPDCGYDRPEKSEAPVATSAPGLSILIAEDNEINALLTRSLLTRLGHAVIVATNGEEALKSWDAALAAGAPYDLVLMDVQMPNLDGIEATRKIREREVARSGRRTTILALTANALIDDRHACLEAGMDGFLVKPLDRERLADALAGVTVARHVPA